jgi:hypothetical protein
MSFTKGTCCVNSKPYLILVDAARLDKNVKKYWFSYLQTQLMAAINFASIGAVLRLTSHQSKFKLYQLDAENSIYPLME